MFISADIITHLKKRIRLIDKCTEGANTEIHEVDPIISFVKIYQEAILRFLTASIDVHICFETEGFICDVEDIVYCKKRISGQSLSPVMLQGER